MDSLEKLYDGAYLIHCAVGGRPLHLPLLLGPTHAVLIDTGCAADFTGAILPALRALKLDPARLTHAINTHCDFDHQGGNSAVMAACPSVRLYCGEADRVQIESPDRLIALRYDAYRRDHGISYGNGVRQAIRRELGEPQSVDGIFRGGELLRLDADRELEILHLPGHSCGHLGVLDRKHQTLFGGDAIHGKVYLDLAGNPALCPTYLYVQPYLETIRRIEKMPIETYVGCHWPIKRGGEITAFCSESRTFVEDAQQLILDFLHDHPQGSTLRELCLQVGPRLGDWPAAVNIELCYAFAGHLADLTSRNVISENRSLKPFIYSL